MRGPNPLNRFKKLGNITVPFGGKTTQEKFHPGVDLGLENGTPIKTPVSGIVTKIDNSHTGVDNSFGNTAEVTDMAGNVHQFHHLKDINVKQGQQVQEGQQIMTGGATGAVYSPSGSDPSSLDYRIVNRFGKYKNPTPLIKKL